MQAMIRLAQGPGDYIGECTHEILPPKREKRQKEDSEYAPPPKRQKVDSEYEYTTINIANISYDTSMQDLMTFLALPGHPEPHMIRMYWKDQKCYAFATMEAKHATAAKNQLHHQDLHGRYLSIHFAEIGSS